MPKQLQDIRMKMKIEHVIGLLQGKEICYRDWDGSSVYLRCEGADVVMTHKQFDQFRTTEEFRAFHLMAKLEVLPEGSRIVIIDKGK